MGSALWYLYDLILVASGCFRDAEGRLVRRWDPEESLPAGAMPAEVLDELDQLRHQVAELAERVDFTERLLASPRSDQDASGPPSPLTDDTDPAGRMLPRPGELRGMIRLAVPVVLSRSA